MPGVREICHPDGITLVEKSLLIALSSPAVRPTGSAPGPRSGNTGIKSALENSPATTCAASWADTPGRTPKADALALDTVNFHTACSADRLGWYSQPWQILGLWCPNR
jgi:hypothetical protein